METPAPLQTERMGSNAWLITVQGRLDQQLSPQLDALLGEFLTAGRVQVVVDLAGVEYINSGGLRSLVSAWRRARISGGDVVLAGLSPRLLDIFQMVGFDRVFAIYADPSSAREAWRDK